MHQKRHVMFHQAMHPINQIKANRKSSLQFSLRRFLLVLGFVGAVFAWHFSDRSFEFSAERELIGNGLVVSSSFEEVDEFGSLSPAFERERRGDFSSIWNRFAWHFRRVRAVSPTSKVTLNDKSVEPLTKLSHVEYLNLGRQPISDQGLKSIQHLHSMKHLYLHSTLITAKGLKGLSKLIQLESLSLDNLDLSDGDLSIIIGHLPCLKDISLSQTGAGSETLKALGKITSLRRICLMSCDITSQDLKALVNLKNLEELDLSWTLIDDHSAETIMEMSSIVDLNLCDTSVGDLFFSKINNLVRLRILSVEETKISQLSIEHIMGLRSLRNLHYDHTIVSQELSTKIWKDLNRRDD